MGVTFSPRDDREMAMLVARIGGAPLELIGQEFGVTRERVRQVLKRAGWEDRYTADEVGVCWFGGVGNTQTRNRLANTLRFQRELRTRRKAERRRQVQRLRELAIELQRPPTLADLARADERQETCRWNARYLRFWLGRSIYRGSPKWANAAARLFRIAGLPKPTRGGNRP